MKLSHKMFCISLFFASVCLFASCEYIVNDALAYSDRAEWNNSSHSEIMLSFSDKTKEDKNVDITINTKKENGSCSVKSRTSTSRTMVVKLSRGLQKGESVEIFWQDSLNRHSLYVD